MAKGRAISLVALLLSLLTLLGCAKAGTPIESTDEELRVIGKIGETDISFDEFRFAVLQCRAQLVSEHGEDFLSREDAEEMILRAVLDNITFNYAIIALCGEVGIHSERDGLAEAVQKEMVKTEEALGSRKEYKRFLKENGLTDRLLRFNTMVDKMQNELYYVYTDDLGIIKTSEEDVYGEILSGFVRTKHIFISRDTKDAEEIASEICLELQNGGSFNALLAEYNEDVQMPTEGYCFPRGYMTEDYETLAYSLRAGQISQVLGVDDGYYIVRREAIDTAYLLTHFEELSERYQQYAFLGAIEEKQAELTFVLNDLGKSIDVLTIE